MKHRLSEDFWESFTSPVYDDDDPIDPGEDLHTVMDGLRFDVWRAASIMLRVNESVLMRATGAILP